MMICFLLFVFFGKGETATDEYFYSYTATDVFLINCGATSKVTTETGSYTPYGPTGRTWTPDQPKFVASNSVNASFPSKASQMDMMLYDLPFQIFKTARIFRSQFTYSFPVSPGWKFLRLHFYPTRYGSDIDLNAVKSFFSVTVNGVTLLRNLTANATISDSPYITKEFIVPVLGGHKTLNLTFTPSPDSLAFINGVEINSMPDRLYTKGGFNGYVRDVGSFNAFEIDNTTVLETLYRVAAGGCYGSFSDTGMYRRWRNDYDFVLGDLNYWNSEISLTPINYTQRTPAYIAPNLVYSNYYINDKAKDLKNSNWTWSFPVDAGFRYLVRLHFCEIVSQITKPGQRMFTIAINNQIAKSGTDVIYMSGGPGIPVHLDFDTFMASDAIESGERRHLRIDLVPDEYSYSKDVILNGIEILKLNDSNGNLAGPNLKPLTLGGRSDGGKLHVLVIVLGSAIGIATFAVVLMMYFRQTQRKNKKENNAVMSKVFLKQYTYAELKKITKSFSRILGKGGFGTVYRGNLCNGVKVAVKVMTDLKGTGEDFINEVTTMSQTSHVNIVSLLGFYQEGSKRAIVYEFLKNGSLDQFISRANSSTLDVTTLYGITLGIARGLEYLHYGCKTRIVHFDIKPQNILLDGNLCPKVSDFGLAKLCEKRESIVSLIDTRGTIGYIAPEVFSRMYGGVSHKSDVYSYGMLVLEIIGGKNKEIVEIGASNGSSDYFPDSIYKDLENEEQSWRFGDEITEEEKDIVKKMILVGLWCIQPCPLDRPSMNKVVVMMEGSLDALEVPPNPSTHISTGFVPESSSLSDGEEIESANT